MVKQPKLIRETLENQIQRPHELKESIDNFIKRLGGDDSSDEESSRDDSSDEESGEETEPGYEGFRIIHEVLNLRISPLAEFATASDDRNRCVYQWN